MPASASLIASDSLPDETQTFLFGYHVGGILHKHADFLVGIHVSDTVVAVGIGGEDKAVGLDGNNLSSPEALTLKE